MVGIGHSGNMAQGRVETVGVGDGVEMCVLVDGGQVLGFLCLSRSAKQSKEGSFQTSNFWKGLSGPTTGPGKSVVCSVFSL